MTVVVDVDGIPIAVEPSTVTATHWKAIDQAIWAKASVSMAK